ncbi:MAG: chemotaxis protein MotB [Alphaproteobacteria bacterium]|nr:chemotaxis protein MotB [Alphaproteobacteria bacterium]NDG04784.1 chemotaxis protein MotB [Alphaproteobacteria bacterium]
MADNQPIIMIRRIKKVEAGHHGGAWKVAYADFVTAMMAFFLLLWLLNVTTDIERKGIADYFAPASLSKSESGAGGALGGQSVTVEGGAMGYESPPTVEERTIATAGLGEEGQQDTPGKASSGSTDDGGVGEGTSAKKTDETGQGAKTALASKSGEVVDAETQKKIAALVKEYEKAEEERFKMAEDALRQAIASSPELRDLAQQIQVDSTAEGLRIQIVDKDNYSMFPSGSAILFEKSRALLLLVGRVIARLPNELAISGHTDSKPFPAGSRRDNWSLSTERANVSRQIMMEAGVPNDRIARVVGRADRDPLDKADPLSSRNRRISIVLVRQYTAANPAGAMNKMPESAVTTPPEPVAPRGAGTTMPLTIRTTVPDNDPSQ